MFSDTERILLTWKVVHKSGHLIQIKKISEEKYLIGDSKSMKEAELRAKKEIERCSTK